MTVLYVVLAVVVLLALAWIVLHNSMVRSRNKVDESWSGIDAQLKRRHDLVPNLVETVKGYAAHERETLGEITDARAQAMAASGPSAQGPAEARLDGALGRINALAEAYPQLRAADNFRQLQSELATIEDEIQASRRIYNANVQHYNSAIQVFPNSIVAGASSFTARAYFELDSPAEREVPAVSFS
jgi:LemA protein